MRRANEGGVGKRVREQDRARAPLLRAARCQAKADVAHCAVGAPGCLHALRLTLLLQFFAACMLPDRPRVRGDCGSTNAYTAPMLGRRYCAACPLWLMVFLSCGHASISLVAPPSRHLQTAPARHLQTTTADAFALRRYPWCGVCQ